MLTRPSAGYNSGSYHNAGRAEPVKGGYDEEETLGLRDEPFDIYADFNNAGPRYSNAFTGGDAACVLFLAFLLQKSNPSVQIPPR